MVFLGLLLIKTLQEPNKNEPPRVLSLSNLSIEGVPNIGFYADFRHNVSASTKRKLFDVSKLSKDWNLNILRQYSCPSM